MSKKKPSALQLEEGCPIPNTHRRLLSAHRLWHQTLAQYDSPDGFRTNLNSTIQELRNVTWVLQKEHAALPAFKDWYATQQQRLQADPLCKWLVAARNRVVKQGDLETLSRARVSVLIDYDRPPTCEFDAPPFSKTRQIAAGLAADTPEFIREDAVLVVERRWIVNDLPDHELLEALAHIFAVLSSVVAEAHAQAGVAFAPVCCAKFVSECTSPNVIPPCMVSGEEKRRVRIKLESGQFVVRREKKVVLRRNDKRVRNLKERYGFRAPLPGGARDLLTMGRELHELAKAILVKDRYHIHLVNLTRGDQLLGFKVLHTEDQADKHLIWHSLAEEIKRDDVDGVIATGEIWRAPFDPANPSRRASESPERHEALQTTIASAAGLERAIVTPFTRDSSGQIALGETYENENRLVFMEPVFEVWRSRRK